MLVLCITCMREFDSQEHFEKDEFEERVLKPKNEICNNCLKDNGEKEILIDLED